LGVDHFISHICEKVPIFLYFAFFKKCLKSFEERIFNL